jgi:hypothetical protein
MFMDQAERKRLEKESYIKKFCELHALLAAKVAAVESADPEERRNTLNAVASEIPRDYNLFVYLFGDGIESETITAFNDLLGSTGLLEKVRTQLESYPGMSAEELEAHSYRISFCGIAMVKNGHHVDYIQRAILDEGRYQLRTGNEIAAVFLKVMRDTADGGRLL